jgi:TrmH family RNA methyltransferase
MTDIRSTANPLIKDLAALKLARRRRETGCFLIEGGRLLNDAFAAGIEVRDVLYTPGEDGEPVWMAAARARNVRIHICDMRCLAKAASTETPQPVVAAAVMPRFGRETVLNRRGPLVVLCGLQDPGNAGALSRCAAAFGARGVIFTEGASDPWNTKCVRASGGALFRLCALALSADEAFQLCREAGLQTLATAPRGGVAPEALRRKGDAALFFGPEGPGLSAEVLRRCEAVVTLPMPGEMESLNVAAAGAILLYLFRAEGDRKR